MNIQATGKSPWRVYQGKRLLATVVRVPASDHIEIRWAGGGVSRCCNLKSALEILSNARVGPRHR